MAKARKTKSSAKPKKARKPLTAEQIAFRKKLFVHGSIALLLFGGLGYGYWQLQKYVANNVAFAVEPPVVVLVNRPPWMSDFLAGEIIKTVRPPVGRSALDHQTVETVANLLNHNPWVKSVRQVRLAYNHSPGDTLEVDCEYRTPIALVRWSGSYVLVDNEGIVLPEEYKAEHIPRLIYGSDATRNKPNIRIIDGVSRRPAQVGQAWPGDDLVAALNMVRLISDEPFAEDILKVDVSNYNGRHNLNDAHITLITRNLTEIRWGRAPEPNDFFMEVGTRKKLARLNNAWKHYGRTDMGQAWIDVRGDDVLIPQSSSASVPQ